MENHYHIENGRRKPDILDVVGQRVDLRRHGKEFTGLCPFHGDKTPSFTVNESKQVFFCHGCHEGGDVISFIRKLDALSFPEALQALGVDSEHKARPKLTASRKRAAEVAVVWAREQRARFNFLLAEKLEQRDYADERNDCELAEIFDREITLLRGFYDALEYPRGIAELLTIRASIEQITDGAQVAL